MANARELKTTKTLHLSPPRGSPTHPISVRLEDHNSNCAQPPTHGGPNTCVLDRQVFPRVLMPTSTRVGYPTQVSLYAFETGFEKSDIPCGMLHRDH